MATKFTASGSGTTTITTAETTDRTVTMPDATDTLVGKATTDSLTNKTFGAGTASVAPVYFTSGTNLTAAAAGAVEYDGTCFYSTPVALARGLSPSTMYSLVPAGDFDIAETPAAQSPFPATGDVWTLNPSTSYLFEGQYIITKTTTTVTVAMVFATGGSPGSTITSIAYTVLSFNGAAGAAPAAPVMTWVNVATSTVVSATTTTNTILRFRGIIRMGAGVGTLTPQIAFSTTTTAALSKVDSYITFTPIGTSTNNILGNVG